MTGAAVAQRPGPGAPGGALSAVRLHPHVVAVAVFTIAAFALRLAQLH